MARTSLRLSRCMWTETCGVGDCKTDIVTPITLSPKLIEPVVHGKQKKMWKLLILEGGIMRDKWERGIVEASISCTWCDILSSKCGSYRDMWIIILSLHVVCEHHSWKTKSNLRGVKETCHSLCDVEWVGSKKSCCGMLETSGTTILQFCTADHRQ